MKQLIRILFIALLIVATANDRNCFALNQIPTQTEPTKQIPVNPFSNIDKQGHRGCRGLYPENTIPAFLHAIDLGVNTIEMDLVITKDEQVILSHEPFFNHEISTAPNGKQINESEEKKYNIFLMTYEQVKKFDVGVKKHPRFPQQKKLVAYKPLLTALLDTLRIELSTRKRKPLFYNIEIKSLPETDGIFHPNPERFTDLVMHIIHQYELESQTIIQSFDIRVLQYVHFKYPSIKTSLLIENTDEHSLEQLINILGYIPDIFSPDYHKVTPQLIRSCKEKNIRIIPWTINTKDEMIRLINLGVDGIITDYPNLFFEN